MAPRIIFLALLVSTLALPLQEQVAQHTDHDYEDDYYDDPKPTSGSEVIQQTEDPSVSVKSLKDVETVNIKSPKIVNIKQDGEELTTEKPVAKYEVTELVIDVPDVNTKRVPIITNFTLTRPLNIAGTPNNITDNVKVNMKDEGDEIINSMLIPDKPVVNPNNQGQNVKSINNLFDINKDENDYFSDFNLKDSIEEEFDKEFGSDENDFDNFEVKEESSPSKGFKHHVHHFGKSIINEFKSVVNKHKDGIHDSLRKIVNGPISFFNNLHRKSSDLAKKIHNAVSRHKDHETDDNIGYHGVNPMINHGYGND